MLLFVAERADAGAAPNTLRGQLRAIEQVHDEAGVTTVGFGRLAAEVIAGVEHGRTAAHRRAPVLPVAELRRMAGIAQNIATADDDLAALRDWLMLAVGYSAGLGVGDLHAARLENLERVAVGYVLRLGGRRMGAVLLAGRDDTLNPIAAIDVWQGWTGLRAGPLLPVVPLGRPSRPISKYAIVERLRRLAARAGCGVRPTGESLRRSWATHAYEAGLDLLSINRRLRRAHNDHSARQLATVVTLARPPRRSARRPGWSRRVNRAVFFCAGTNRFGRPCNNRVTADGECCGRCSAGATHATPPSATAARATDEWTLAPTLGARLAPLAENNPKLQRLVEVCVRLARNSRAEGSKAVYDQHWRTFCVFCDTVGLSAELPVTAETAACFLAWLADAGRVDRTTGERCGSGEPLRHGYLRQAVAAIGYRHTLEGLTSPTHDPLVQAVLRGYGRIHGTDVRGKDPIRLDDLTRLATALPRPAPLAARDRALALLVTNPTFGLNAGQLARLDGEHILWPATPDEPIVLLAHPGGRSLGLDVIEIPPDHDTPDACAARALTDLEPDAFGPVFRSASKQRLSRQAILKILRTRIAAAGLADSVTTDGIPRLAEPDDRARLARHITNPDPTEVRDLALVLNLYWGSFRGSELCAMRWDDTHIVARGVEWTVPRAKNDQLGRGETVGAARNPNSVLCPATALETWQAALTGLLDREPHGDEPVFVRLDRPLDHLEAITRDGASQIVKRAARAAGLVGDYANHSLRAGFVTDALDAGATREQVQRHGRWTNITSIDPYYRKTLVWGPSNPSQRLAGP